MSMQWVFWVVPAVIVLAGFWLATVVGRKLAEEPDFVSQSLAVVGALIVAVLSLMFAAGWVLGGLVWGGIG
jgi:hypothetical protein